MSAQPTNHGTERLGEPNRLTEDSRDQSAGRQLNEDRRKTRRLGQRYTVQEALEILGTSVDAIRGRIRRGTLDSLKVEGVVYVLLDVTNREQHAGQSPPNPSDSRQSTVDQSQLAGEMRDQIDWLRREVERKDTIIMSLTQRIPELEAPLEPRDSPETVSEGTKRKADVTLEPQAPSQQRSWFYRFFFGPG